MSEISIAERISDLLEEKYRTDEMFADCYTVEVELKPNQRLYVFADSDSGMSFEKCQKLSRYLESFIDTNGWLGEKYVLEVSSPGIGRPLKFPRQYKKNIGRTLAVSTTAGENHTATLAEATDEHIMLTQTVVEKVEKKKVERVIETTIPYASIQKAVVKLAF